MFESLMRFFGMYSPSQSVRIAMYRKAGIRIGSNVVFGSHNWLDINFRNMITIGDNAALAGHDIVLSHDFLLSASFHSEAAKLDGFRPVIIKNGVRIGAHVMILAGVVIGERSIIGAGALVIGDIPADCLAVGVPAKPVKYFK